MWRKMKSSLANGAHRHRANRLPPSRRAQSLRPFSRPRSTVAALRRDLEFSGIQFINGTTPRMQLGVDRQNKDLERSAGRLNS
jgi:hypothetical protein